MMRFYLGFTFWLILSLANIFNSKTLLASASAIPGEGTPQGTPQPGGSRPANLCPSDIAIPLTAILSNNNHDFTTQNNPKFWFYVPYRTENVNYMEFTILDQDGLQSIYETQFDLVDEPGIIRVSLPETSEPLMEENTLYRWSFKLYCQGNFANEPDQDVSGWILNIGVINDTEVSENPYLAYREKEVWYDAISTVFEQYSQNPNDPQNYANWVELLQFLSNPDRILPNYPIPPNYEELSGKYFVDTEEISIE